MTNPDHHYLEHLTTLGESTRVVAAEHILSQGGLRLLRRGTRINRQVLRLLLKHKLLRPIDRLVLIDGALNRDTLVRDALALLERNTEMAAIARSQHPEHLIQQTFKHLTLDTALRNKLTVARQQRLSLFEHSLRVTIVAVLVAEAIGLIGQELGVVAEAALFHDIGELHLDPAIYASSAPLTADQRRQIRTHPTIGHLILQELSDYHPSVARAVLEHHERSDGSGYPEGIDGADMCRPGRVLAFAEFAVGLAQKSDLGHLHTAVKLASAKFDREMVAALAGVLRRRAVSEGQGDCHVAFIRNALENLSEILSEWPEASASADNGAAHPPREFIASHLELVRRELVQVGLPANAEFAAIAGIETEPDSCRELASVLRELLHQLRQTLGDAEWRWPALTHAPVESDEGKLCAWIAAAQQRLAGL